MLGVFLGSFPGWASGMFLPWWIAGLPCYIIVAALWIHGIRGELLIGIFWGCLTAAACAGVGSPISLLIAMLTIFGLLGTLSPEIPIYFLPSYYLTNLIVGLLLAKNTL